MLDLAGDPGLAHPEACFLHPGDPRAQGQAPGHVGHEKGVLGPRAVVYGSEWGCLGGF